jgi:hypothetical protein
LIKLKKLLARFGTKSNLYFGKNNMIGGCYGLQVHSNTYNSVMFTSVLCKATTTVESRSKRYYNPFTKTKT